MKQKKGPLLIPILCFFIFISCNDKKNEILLEGDWHAELNIEPGIVPFSFGLKKNGEKWGSEIYNADEVLSYDEVDQFGDSLIIHMGIFDSDIKAAVQKDGSLKGYFIKNHLEGYRIPFTATKGLKDRFSTSTSPIADFSGKWKTEFEKSNGEKYDAIGIFKQEGDHITGTFLTSLGDYRYLEGNVDGDTFYLSAFDGSHVYFFSGKNLPDGSIHGTFRSGPKYRESFFAVRDEAFELPDANSLNYLKDGYERLSFSFPDLNKNMVSLEDEKFKDKVVLVQLFGTWCPNCMDETKYLAEWYRKNKNREIEIIALAFEYKADFDYASARVRKTKERMNAEYIFLVAGESNKEKASEALPALNQVIAFPTLIYIGRDGKVKNIHTGFSGPGTGAYYERWVEEHENLVNRLLEE
ncbi:TlpA disulfide reductase family protein [Shivajiella indica]|uniref:TlpA disulfide reductase family protein n=1 Tax=Shivajiella indica TaxID=872115 RepID=A0ABW5BC73_9BACT